MRLSVELSMGPRSVGWKCRNGCGGAVRTQPLQPSVDLLDHETFEGCAHMGAVVRCERSHRWSSLCGHGGLCPHVVHAE
eukprot:8973468-Pyramimonas_sp.AAC.1